MGVGVMPKENIYSRYANETVPVLGPDGNPTGDRIVAEDTRIHVGWNNDHVEIAVLNPSAPSMDGTAVPGWFVQLDRDGINRLIRTLRKARDQAFGADA